MEKLEDLVRYGRRLVDKNLVAGAGGNTSIRIGDVAYLSPSGVTLDEAGVDDYVPVDIKSGEIVEEKPDLQPTSETPLHLEIYRIRDDVQAVVHGHPPLLTGLVSGGRKVEPLTPEFVAVLDHVEIIPYIVPTGHKLAQAVKEKIQSCSVLALINHGAITVGSNLKEAFFRMEVLEGACKTQLAAIIAGNPRILRTEEVEEIRNLDAVVYRRGKFRE